MVMRIAALIALLACLTTATMSAASAREGFLDLSSQSLEAARRSVVSVLPEWPPSRQRNEEPEASGVVWTDGKHIVTALHVVAKARATRIRTEDGRIFNASLRARDRETDLAVLSVDAQLPPVTLATADVGLGEDVCAIGNAFGLGLSVTCGVVSARARSGVGFNRIEDFVQTDAAVNPGASGGALVDRQGHLVGILSAIFTKKSDANIGVNFAVSKRLTARVVEELVAYGKVRRLRSGLRFETSATGLRSGSGSLIAPRIIGVANGSPAARAGLRIGDRVVAVNGRRTISEAGFLAGYDLATPSGRLDLLMERDGVELQAELDLGTLDKADETRERPQTAEQAPATR